MYVFESTTACCEPGVEDVVMTTVAMSYRSLLHSYFSIDTMCYLILVYRVGSSFLHEASKMQTKYTLVL